MALSKTAKSRLMTLIKFMASLPKSAEEHFSMGHYYHHDGHHQSVAASDGTITQRTLKDCGTSACAAGWAATIPAFKKAGFRLELDGGFTKEPQDFFDINCFQESALFFNFSVKTPKAWAAMARAKVKEWSKREG